MMCPYLLISINELLISIIPFIDINKYGFNVKTAAHKNVRDKVGPLEDNAGNIITQGFVMAEELNMHLSPVFTREDTSS